MQKISEGSIDLNARYARRLYGPKAVGTGLLREESLVLSQMIDIVNDRFGTTFNRADQIFFDQIIEAAVDSTELHQAAMVNSEDKFGLIFTRLLDSLFIERMDQNEEIFARTMNETAFKEVISGLIGEEVYRRIASDTEREIVYP